MLSLILLIIFIYCSYVAYRRGIFFQTVFSGIFLVSLLIASLTYRLLIPMFTLFVPYPSANADSKFVFFSQTTGLNLDKSFYAATSFIFVLLLSWVILNVFASGFADLRYIQFDEKISVLGAILLSLIVTNAVITLILFTVAMIPVAGMQQAIDHSILAKALIRYSPIWTNLYTHLFIGIM